MEEKAGTPLDDLYNLLLKKKIMRVEDIASHFKVSKDLVMEWGKILEAGELATISNPRIGKPVIKLISHTGESKEELSEGEIIETKLKTQEDIIQKNKLIINKKNKIVKKAQTNSKKVNEEYVLPVLPNFAEMKKNFPTLETKPIISSNQNTKKPIIQSSKNIIKPTIK